MPKRQASLKDSLKNRDNKKGIKEKQTNESNKTQKKIKELEQEILKHRDLYYNKTPEISDAEFDLLEDQLRKLDPNNPILFQIGADSSELFEKKEHIIPMGSQDKVTKPAEFRKWAKNRSQEKYIVQFKLDGISIELQYKSGIFQSAITRGNGVIGDDVTKNVMNMKGFMPKLKARFTGGLRAEILLFHDIFDSKYSDKQNCRNAAAGIVRRKDGEGCEDLNLIFYDAVSLDDEVNFKNEMEKLKWMKDENLPTIKTKVLSSIDDVIEVRENVMNNLRDTLDYDIDGLVIKSNEIDLEDMRRSKPTKQVAFKFQAETAETTVVDVEWSISGPNYTPVAIVNPVRLAGTTVSRASLANPNLVQEMGLKIGSEVLISKRGDIIPKIEEVINTSEIAQEITIPNTCETCGTKLINEGTRLYCPNESCPKRDYQRLQRWLWILGVKHFSEKLMLQRLFEAGKVKYIADLYSLKISDLTKFEGVKETSAKKALDNLYAVKDLSLSKFIAGFNIENIGELLVKKVVDAGFDTLDKIKNASVQEISEVEGFAETTAKFLLDGIEKVYPQMIDVLETERITIQESKKDGKLNGLSFCFTGKLNEMSRSEAEALVLKEGGEPKSSVTKNLSYLVTNETTPTAKYLKAKEQGTEIITEEQFLKLISD
jgi:DNA ligase (NAD+)